MATRSETYGLMLQQGIKPYDRIKNQEAARLSAGHAPLRENLERTKIARVKQQVSAKGGQTFYRRMLRFKRFKCHTKKEKPLRWT